MTIAVNIQVSGFDVAKFSEKMAKELPEKTNNATYDYCRYLANKLRIAAITDPLRTPTTDRINAANLIMARKETNTRSVVVMPRSLVMLDSMSPHYVSLKRGRGIVDWVRRNYGKQTVSGKSKVLIGQRGGIKGYLYVVPHRFVQATLNRERNKLPNYLRKAITKAYKASYSTR